MPFYRFDLVSPLAVQAVLLRFHTLVRADPGFLQSIKESIRGRPDGTPAFIGKFDGSVVHMRRDIRYRNSFLPRIRASVTPTPNGTLVHVTMHLHPFVAVFMLLWLGAVGIAGVAACFTETANGVSGLIPVAMFVFGVGLTIGCFYPEAYKARRLLEKGIDARIA